MKKLTALIALVTLVLGCGVEAQPTDTRFEVQMMECVYASYPDKGTSLKKAIVDYEALLVEEGILEEASGKAYVKFLEDFGKNEALPTSPSIVFSSFYKEVPNAEFLMSCSDALANVPDPKGEAMDEALEGIQYTDDFTPSGITSRMLTVLNEEDFELNFYKLKIFNILQTAVTPMGIERKLPPIVDTPPPPPPLPENIIDISVKEGDKIYINGKRAGLDQVGISVKEFLTQKAGVEYVEIEGLGKQEKTLGVVYLSNGKHTYYDAYIAVQNRIVEAYAELRDERSQKLFGKSYCELSKEEGKVIKELIPHRLYEFEPQSLNE